MGTITVKSGPLAGRKYESLLDLLDDQQVLIEACDHAGAKPYAMIVGILTGKPREVSGLDCPACGQRWQTASRVLSRAETRRERVRRGYAGTLAEIRRGKG